MNTTKKIILVPVDFSEQSLVAVNHAEEIAKTLKGTLLLLHVHVEQSLITSFFSSEEDDKVTQEIWKRMNDLCDEVEQRSGIRTSPLVAKGKVYEEVVRLAEITGASFIVMGTNGSDTIRKRFIGSNALRVVRESRVPVISIKGKPEHVGFKNIILPLDLTKETREKVNKAIELSRNFNAQVKVVSILMTDDEEVVNKLQLQMNQVRNFLERAEVKYTAEIKNAPEGNDNLGEEVVRYANDNGGDLIMIMTQQETNFTDLFIGSAAQEVINNAAIPVCSIVPNVKKDTTVFVPY
jgi:nucleotide-binding universal stress UspA family protein